MTKSTATTVDRDTCGSSLIPRRTVMFETLEEMVEHCMWWINESGYQDVLAKGRGWVNQGSVFDLALIERRQDGRWLCHLFGDTGAFLKMRELTEDDTPQLTDMSY